MDELSEAAKSLIEQVNREDLPAADQAEQSWGVLQTRLTQEAAPEAEPTPGAAVQPPTQHGQGVQRWTGVAVLTLALGAAGALAWLLVQRPPRAGDPAARDTAPVVATPRPPPVSATAAPSPERQRVPAAPEDPAALLKQAEAAIGAGDGATALTALERHAEIAPVDPQRDLRMVLRIEALCSIGRKDHAKAEARAFATGQPAAALADRVTRSCAAD